MSDITYTLWCLIGGDEAPFSVTVLPTMSIDQLKATVKERKGVVLQNVSATELILWKVDEGVVLKNRQDTREYRINTDGKQPLWEMDEILDIWPEPPTVRQLNIFIDRPVGAVSPTQPEYSLPLPLSNISLRSNTVSRLYEKLMKYAFILVRGTPASGKTVLTQLLSLHIEQRDRAVKIVSIPRWPLQDVKEAGGWREYLRRHHWVEGEKTYFIFDEAQSSYSDVVLWNDFFKSLTPYGNQFAIAFASYGSPTSRLDIPNTPHIVNDVQRVTLRATDHGDGLGAVGLLFTREEFDDLVDKSFPSSRYHFHHSFYDVLFGITRGHVGAIHDLMGVVSAHDSYRHLKHTSGELYTRELFLEKVTLSDLMDGLQRTSSIFKRGLPLDEDLQNADIADVFLDVLREGSKVQTSKVDAGPALTQCFRNGWLHADKLGTPRKEKIVYTFPSPLHRWFVERKLCDWEIDSDSDSDFDSETLIHAIQPDSGSLLQLAIDVIKGFTPGFLGEQRIGPGCIQSPPEAQYQDEFYRSCHTRWKGSLTTFPEFGTKNGRVYFYIPSKQWGVELLREGNRLDDHSSRFSESGAYGKYLTLKDYIMLDCRTSRPRLSHGEIAKLYHVIFSNQSREVSIVDNLLQPIIDRTVLLHPT